MAVRGCRTTFLPRCGISSDDEGTTASMGSFDMSSASLVGLAFTDVGESGAMACTESTGCNGEAGAGCVFAGVGDPCVCGGGCGFVRCWCKCAGGVSGAADDADTALGAGVAGVAAWWLSPLEVAVFASVPVGWASAAWCSLWLLGCHLFGTLILVVCEGGINVLLFAAMMLCFMMDSTLGSMFAHSAPYRLVPCFMT